MDIFYFRELDSTQTFLKEKLKNGEFHSPVAVVAEYQSKGIGSRGNQWIGCNGNLFFSFAINKKELPEDLLLESSSIYFSYLLKEVLAEKGSLVWLKWPNDFYLNAVKIGGTITQVYKDDLICGIGLNLESSPEEFAHLDIEIDKKLLLEEFFKKIKNKSPWKQIFSKYKIEFSLSKRQHTTFENNKISLENAVLNSDGSLSVNGKRMYSLR